VAKFTPSTSRICAVDEIGSNTAAPAVRRLAAGLVLGEQLGRRAPTGLLLEVEVAERLPVASHQPASRLAFFKEFGRTFKVMFPASMTTALSLRWPSI